MTTVFNNSQRGAIKGQHKIGRIKTAAAVNANRIVEFTSGNVQQAQTGSRLLAGFTKDYTASGGYAEVFFGPGVVTVESPVTAGQELQAGISGKVMPLITADNSGDTLDTSSVGLGFGNQPANDGIEVLSSSAADTTQSVTVYGTTTATDTVVVETIALNGTTPVASVKLDWGQILGYTISASCAGTVTVQEASGSADISTATTGILSKGLDAVTGTTLYAYNIAPTMVGSGATTKQVGLIGTNSAGTTIYDSQALSGTTPQTMNVAFNTITYILTGDLENSVTTSVALGAVSVESTKVGRAMETQATADGLALCHIGL